LTSIELPAGFDDSILRSAGVPPSAHHGALRASAHHGAHPFSPQVCRSATKRHHALRTGG
jgi:hypothetical protein